jgi:hypothetical protein
MRALVAALAIMLCMSAARADSCDKSRDYILASSDLPQKPQTYRDLSNMCRDTLLLSNVKEAFVLKAGAVAAVPKIDSVSATASTLSQFCTRFPKGTLRFVNRNELRQAANTAQAIRIGVGNATPCQKIVGGG